ncbi:cache domain-containing protein [Massilia antarctica]|uniref:Cache domain-containing protein n=1 Tax=Massilia antarctica TaxID=2765360 RepID=A0AA48WE37_9BURK|nr:cache domain-containing protein [Massilia antarctica]QPI50633.1 cache domain-containing protein [Massilia antarctica]
MNRLVKWLAVLGMASLMAAAGAAERGTSEEAVALVKKAIAYYKTNGMEKTAAEINGKTGMFESKDLYLFIAPVAPGPVMAHGANAKLVGKDLNDMRDVDGVYFTRRFREVAAKEGKGWVEYKWPNSKSGALEPKSTYVERVDDVYFACGVYKPGKS